MEQEQILINENNLRETLSFILEQMTNEQLKNLIEIVENMK